WVCPPLSARCVRSPVRNTCRLPSKKWRPARCSHTRLSGACGWSWDFLHHVTDATDGVQKFRGGLAVNFFAQPPDVNIHQVCAGIEIIVPDIFHDGHAAAHAAGGTEQKFEQAIFTRRKFDGSFTPF